MGLIQHTQLRAFVIEGLSRLGEEPVGLETEQHFETAAVHLTTRQLAELADVLDAIADSPEVFAFEAEEATLPAHVLYCEIEGNLYRRWTAPERPKFIHPESFVELDDDSLWREVMLGKSGLTLNGLRELSSEAARAQAKTLRSAIEQLSHGESFKSLEELKNNVTQVFEEIYTPDPAKSSTLPLQDASLTTLAESRLFQQETISAIPTAVAMVSSIYAQLRKDLWKQDERGIGYFQHRAKGNPNNYVEHYISSPGDVEILPWEQAEQIIDKFGFTTVKLHLLFAAHTMNQTEPWKSGFVLKGTTILKELGWDRRTDIPLHEKLNEIARAAFVLDCLLVRSVWVEGRRSSGRLDASTPTGRMWTVVIDRQGQLDMDGELSHPEEVYLGVQPGMIFERFLNKAGSKLKEALYQFGYIAQEVLKIDPYHDELALRLAIHLTMDSRIHPSGKYQVGSLLETILPKAIVETARKDYRRAFDLKKRWDSALLLLMQLNWTVEFDESYAETIRPGNSTRNPKGYFDLLLLALITIKPRTPIPELIAGKSEQKASTRKLKPTANLTGEDIQKAREAKKWSQRKLAGWMGISQSLINHWEKGKRIPSSEQEARLRLVLNISNE